MLSVVAAIFACLLTVSIGRIFDAQTANAQAKRTEAKGIETFSLLRGQSLTFVSGTVLEALQDGTAVLIGGGGSIVTWTFKDHDLFVMDQPYQTVKNRGDGILMFRAIEVCR